MHIFLSWSGSTSRKVAEAIREWLPYVVPSVKPYVSSEDIDKGARWASDIAKELEVASYGLIFVTRENLAAPWILFEAGALSKFVDKARVVPILFNVKKSELEGPLLQFQAAECNKNEIEKIIMEINDALGDGKAEKDRLHKSFTVWWPKLEEVLNGIPSADECVAPEQSGTREKILDEILENSRNQLKLLGVVASFSPKMLVSEHIKELRPLIGDAISECMDWRRMRGGVEFDHPAFFDLLDVIERTISYISTLDGKMEKDEFDRLRDFAREMSRAHEFLAHKLIQRRIKPKQNLERN